MAGPGAGRWGQTSSSSFSLPCILPCILHFSSRPMFFLSSFQRASGLHWHGSVARLPTWSARRRRWTSVTLKTLIRLVFFVLVLCGERWWSVDSSMGSPSSLASLFPLLPRPPLLLLFSPSSCPLPSRPLPFPTAHRAAQHLECTLFLQITQVCRELPRARRTQGAASSPLRGRNERT